MTFSEWAISALEQKLEISIYFIIRYVGSRGMVYENEFQISQEAKSTNPFLSLGFKKRIFILIFRFSFMSHFPILLFQ